MIRLIQFVTRMRRLFSVSLLLALLSPALRGADASGRAATPIEQGFASMYNLDFAAAHQDFEAWQKLHPEDPMGPACQAAAHLFTEFARLGVLESQLFTDENRFDNRQKLNPDPQVKNMINAELDQADSLAAKALAKDPNDANAQFAKILSLGLRSDYAALIEKRDLAAIRYTKQGTALAEQLLKQDPNAYDAYLAVGVENYLSGIKPAPMRWLMAAGGVETDKTRGIHDLELTAAHGDLLAPFARLLLAVAALRDKEPAKACSILSGLSSDYPKNPLYPREISQNHCQTEHP
jgi:tetratricopeptide (TPR) repeat protein